MGKFWEDVKKAVWESDVVVHVLDARLPWLSRSRDIERIAAQYNKELIYVVNKSDLVSREFAERTRKEIGNNCITLSVKKRIGLNKLRERIMIIGKKATTYGQVRVCFVGYPNVGKSSILNALAYRAKAAVSPKAGTTRGVQWVSAQNLKILDSPGVIPVNEWDETRLALICSKDAAKVKNPEKVALGFFDFLNEQDPSILKKAYSIEYSDYESFLLNLGKRKGFLKKGGIVDERKTAFAFIKDWQDGKIKL